MVIESKSLLQIRVADPDPGVLVGSGSIFFFLNQIWNRSEHPDSKSTYHSNFIAIFIDQSYDQNHINGYIEILFEEKIEG